MSTNIKKLNIEVIRSTTSTIPSKELSDLVKSELKSVGNLVLNTSIKEFKNKELQENVSLIQICDLDSCDDISNELEIIKPGEVKLNLHVYRLYQDGSHADLTSENGEDQITATYWTLPTREFNGLWDSLIFDTNIKEKLLKYAWTLVQYSLKKVNTTVISCNRIILLHGPPGTGKTTLCKAIVQKLSIRLSSHYSHTVLIEINAHSLFSKYFSESGKLVTRMFAKLTELVIDPKTLVCVLIDEVESLTHSREAASKCSEPSDAVRVVNAVLTQLDLLKQYPNVLVFSTSNISGVVDGAFVDRADICFYIPNPSSYAIYSIYYSVLEELIRVGIVEGPAPLRIKNKQAYSEADSMSSDEAFKSLKYLSDISSGMSGRSVRKAPILAHAYHLPSVETVPLLSFLKAMQDTIKDMRKEPS